MGTGAERKSVGEASHDVGEGSLGLGDGGGVGVGDGGSAGDGGG